MGFAEAIGAGRADRARYRLIDLAGMPAPSPVSYTASRHVASALLPARSARGVILNERKSSAAIGRTPRLSRRGAPSPRRRYDFRPTGLAREHD